MEGPNTSADQPKITWQTILDLATKFDWAGTVVFENLTLLEKILFLQFVRSNEDGYAEEEDNEGDMLSDFLLVYGNGSEKAESLRDANRLGVMDIIDIVITETGQPPLEMWEMESLYIPQIYAAYLNTFPIEKTWSLDSLRHVREGYFTNSTENDSREIILAYYEDTDGVLYHLDELPYCIEESINWESALSIFLENGDVEIVSLDGIDYYIKAEA